MSIHLHMSNHVNNPSGFRTLILLLLVSGAAALLVSCVSASTGVTLAALGDQSYYQGEKVVFTGNNYDSDSTYLFMTGPGIPVGGGKLTSPLQQVVSGNPDSFTVVKTKLDRTWEFSWYTANLTLDAGSYTVYAASQPKDKDQQGPAAAHIGIIVKKPFLTGEISPGTISKGMPFTVSGFAEGNPPHVQIWIFGKNYYSRELASVNSNASYTYEVSPEVTSHLETGQYFVIVQHSMQNNQFDIDVSGDYVRNLQLNNGTNLFRIAGPGSLQGSDAADALIAALSDLEANDDPFTHDTYAIIPFQVSGAGSPTPLAQATTTSVESPTQPSLLPFALIGSVVLVLGIVVWRRR